MTPQALLQRAGGILPWIAYAAGPQNTAPLSVYQKLAPATIKMSKSVEIPIAAEKRPSPLDFFAEAW